MKRNRKKISRQEAVYRVALAGISAAVALLMVWLGVVVRYSTIAFFIAASVAIMIPLSQKYYLSSILAYVVSAGLSFLVAGDVFSVMGYVVYFGPMAIISGVMLNHSDKVKWWIQLIIKIVYINGALALLYFVCHNIVIDSSIADKIQYWMVALGGTAVLIALDYAVQFIYKRMAIVVGKALRKSENHRSKHEENCQTLEEHPSGDTPFDEFSNVDSERENDDDLNDFLRSRDEEKGDSKTDSKDDSQDPFGRD